MEPLTTAILARGIYDLLQAGAIMSKKAIKDSLTKFIADEKVVEELSSKIESIPLNKDMKPEAIEKKLNLSPEVVEILQKAPAQTINNIDQIHTGQGDNVAGNKIVHG